MISYDKVKIKEMLTTEQVYSILSDFGGDPEYADFGIISTTICHNYPGEGSRKLYYYSNSHLLNCYTSCGSFDIFELVIKVFQIQESKEIDLNAAVRWVADRLGYTGESVEETDMPSDWKYLDNYDRLSEIDIKDYHVELKEYDDFVLSQLNYDVKITPWLNEGITQEAIDKFQIGYYPGADMITIPHFDKDARFIGLRGRALAADDIERFGKYRPIKINNQWYNHSLGMNLYGLNTTKDNISTFGKAIIFESEKSVLLYESYFPDSNIAVACCGSNVSAYHIALLLEAGAKEIVIALDRQFQEVGNPEFKKLTTNLTKLNNRYKNNVLLSFIFDKNMITEYKASPIDEGKEKFLQLYKERIIL